MNERMMLTEAKHRTLVTHYDLVAPKLVKQFGAIPIEWVEYPGGFHRGGLYRRDVDPLPASIPTVDADTASGSHRYITLAGNSVLWLVHAKYAVEFVSWTPQPAALATPRFGHITIEPSPTSTMADVRAAARTVRAVLQEDGRDAIPVLDGVRGITLWIDARGAASYDDLAHWLIGVADSAAARDAEHLTTAWLRADRGGRVYLGTKSNHPGNFVTLPYVTRGTPGFTVTWPLAWDRLDDVDNGEIDAANVAERFEAEGDVFAALVDALPPPSAVPAAGTKPAHPLFHAMPFLEDESKPAPPSGREYIITAAREVLRDGDTLSAEQIRDAAVKAGLLPAATLTKYVYAALHEYIIREIGGKRTPEFLQIEHTENFRINQPADPWPATDLPPRRRRLTDAAAASLIANLTATSTGTDTAGFEVAVMDGFRALGFVAEHVGGHGQPDGVLTAALGPLGQVAIVECKTANAGANVANPRPEEPAKFREAFGATRALLIGPAFSNDASFLDELKVHAVALWTVDDLVLAIREELTPYELLAAFEPGPVSATLAGLVWERAHGERKRIAVVAGLIARLGWQTQVRLAKASGPSAPALTDDVLLVLIDQALAEINPTLLLTRELLQAAIGSLIASGAALRTPSANALVIIEPQPAP